MGKATLGASNASATKKQTAVSPDIVEVPVVEERIVEVIKHVEVPVEVIKEVEVVREVRVEVPVEVVREVPVVVTEIRQVPVEVIKEVEKVIRVEDMGKLRDLNREIRALKEDKKLLKILLGMAVVVAIIAGVS
jgi:hypothetical protein